MILTHSYRPPVNMSALAASMRGKATPTLRAQPHRKFKAMRAGADESLMFRVRHELNMSQKAMAVAIGFRQYQTIGHHEAANTVPEDRTIWRRFYQLAEQALEQLDARADSLESAGETVACAKARAVANALRSDLAGR